MIDWKDVNKELPSKNEEWTILLHLECFDMCCSPGNPDCYYTKNGIGKYNKDTKTFSYPYYSSANYGGNGSGEGGSWITNVFNKENNYSECGETLTHYEIIQKPEKKQC